MYLRAAPIAISATPARPHPVLRLLVPKAQVGVLPDSPRSSIPALEGVDVADKLDE